MMLGGRIMKEVSEKIKLLRNEKKKTLKQLSEQTGLSVSFLSQVERGESSLAITSLSKIADALDTHITSFFKPQYAEDYKISPEKMKPFTIQKSDQKFFRASGQFSDRKLDNYIILLPPGDYSEPSSHQGEEVYYILKGEIVFHVGNHKYLVKKGELMHFPSTIKHYYTNESGKTAKFLCVLTPKLF
jgi:transcriptional regulator with XRE-family HTH domain